METLKFGTIYWEGEPQKPNFFCQNSDSISIGDTVPGMEIQWVRHKNLLIADRCVCTNISWEDLEQIGYATGIPISIDGIRYNCRCPKIGAEKKTKAEWGMFLDLFGRDEKDWHTEGQFFWGLEAPKARSYMGHRMAAGFHAPGYKGHYMETMRVSGIGFRPLLEIQEGTGKTRLSKALIGKQVRLFGERGAVKGRLAGYDDYDIVLDGDLDIYPGCNWVLATKTGLVANREKVFEVQKV